MQNLKYKATKNWERKGLLTIVLPDNPNPGACLRSIFFVSQFQFHS
jgi:hypothetical protein